MNGMSSSAVAIVPEPRYTGTMNADEIKKRLGREHATLERLGVASLRLFGSLARGTGGPASDADFVVAFKGPVSFDRYMDLKLFLEDTLGCRVDLVTEAALRPAIR
jgi:predicted nucleotidyltransferase